MLAGKEVLEFLATDSVAPEAGRSSYWDEGIKSFEVDADGTISGFTPMGILTGRGSRAKRFFHWVLQAPFRWFGAPYPDHRRLQRIGRTVAARQGRSYWLDTIRQVLSLSLIHKHVALDDRSNATLVIGDGLGIMTALLLLAFPLRKVILVNLTKPLLLDLVHVTRAVPELRFALARDADEIGALLADSDIRLIAVRADDSGAVAGAPVDLAINILSMQEMTLPVVSHYFDVIRRSASNRVVFYCCNRIRKRYFDGPSFFDYPWRPGDEILLDGRSWWDQFYYSKTPPFWHYRWGKYRVTWHRLAALEKLA